MSVTAPTALRNLRKAGLQPPRHLTIAITGVCNLQCGHCLVAAGEVGSAGHLPERTLRRLLAEFVDLEGEGIRFTGGEPLCHPAWLRLLQYVRSLGIENVAIQTNGMLWTAEDVEAVCSLDFPRLTLQVSLDGAGAATHDRVRGKGAFAGVMAGLKLLGRGGLGQQITLCFTEMRHNLAEFPALLKLAEDLGIRSVTAGTMVRGGRGLSAGLLTPPDPDQYLRLRQLRDADPDFRRRYEQIGSMAPLEWGWESVARNDCCNFAENPYLTADGTLYPCLLCHSRPYGVEGVTGKSLSAAFSEGVIRWAQLLEESGRRGAELAACAGCPGQQVCVGGCMGRAWAANGELCSTDDRCRIRRAIYSLNPPVLS